MHCVIAPLKMLGHVVNLRMAIVTGGNAIIGRCINNLIVFQLAKLASLFRETGLQIAAAAAATVVVGFVWMHLNEIIFPHHGLDDKAEVFGHRVTKSLPDKLTGVLNGELDLQLFVPIRIYLELSLPDPLRIQLNDALDFKVVLDVELLQSGPDCKELMTSFGIEPNLTTEVIHSLGLDPHDMLPSLPVLGEHAVVFCGPSLGAIGPVCPG